MIVSKIMSSNKLFFVLVISFLVFSTYALLERFKKESLKEELNTPDRILSKIIEIHDLEPMQVRSFYPDPLYKFGQLLFFDPVLSGKRNISCATCHDLKRGLSDGRRNSNNLEILRTTNHQTDEIVSSYRLRNSPDLWNRDANENVALFWDGRIEVLDPEQLKFRSVMLDDLYSGFTNILEIQSIFPLATEDEMKGKVGSSSASSLPYPHGGMINEFATDKEFQSEVEELKYIQKKVVDRILGRGSSKPQNWQLQYREYFSNAFPQSTLATASIMHVGKAIGHFEEFAFASHDSRWDLYIKGDDSALTNIEKEGAILFYSKGLCATCHTGRLFSDGLYHNVGIISEPLEFNGAYLEDLGRFGVTGLAGDKYKFKTPQLRNVTQSAPYFHDGSSSNLGDALSRHANLRHGGDTEYFESGLKKLRRRHLQTLSPIYKVAPFLSKAEIRQIEAFLKTLESQSRSDEQIIPKNVPSGLISYSN